MVGVGHTAFGEEFCEKFDVGDYNFVEWAYAPDYGYYFGEDWNMLMHRFTLHGLDNVQSCIDLLKDEEVFDYDEDYELEIKTLIASHTYLDTFNFYVVPSYPHSSKFVRQKNRGWYYIKAGFGHFVPKYRAYSPPKEEWKDKFSKILSSFPNPSVLYDFISDEVDRMPDDYTTVTEELLELYE